MSMIHRVEPTSENIFVDLRLGGEFWQKPPEVDIFVDGKLIQSHLVDRTDYHVRFRHVMDFGPHRLELRRKNKTNDQNRLLPDGSYQGQLLHINQVRLDNIDLRNLVLHTCKFQPEYPEPWASQQREAGIILENELIGETHLGHNGVWTFDFISPIYMFLVDWARKNTK